MKWQSTKLLVHRDHFIQVSLLIRKGGHWPPSAFLEDSHDQRDKWRWPGPDRSGPRRGKASHGPPGFQSAKTDLVAKAAKAMNLTVCKADGEALAELAKKLPNGRLYATGHGFVPPVGRSLYGKLVEQLQLAGQPVPRDADQANAQQPAPGLPATWDDIAVGHLVIAHEAPKEPWWAAIVVARDGDMLTLKWRDYPHEPNVVRHAGAVALLKPTPVST